MTGVRGWDVDAVAISHKDLSLVPTGTARLLKAWSHTCDRFQKPILSENQISRVATGSAGYSACPRHFNSHPSRYSDDGYRWCGDHPETAVLRETCNGRIYPHLRLTLETKGT
eukprot:5937332-Pyramimonas_sp.AAC.1